jgi:hypothetical protein
MLPPPEDLGRREQQVGRLDLNYGAIRVADDVPFSTTTVGVVAGATG